MRAAAGSAATRGNARCPSILPLLAGLLALAFVAAGSSRDSLARRIEAALSAKALAKARIGILVETADTGRVLFSRGANDLFVTASNTKIVTTAAALDLLGPDYTFATRFVAQGEIEAGVLKGDLVVVGGGDPNLSGRFHDGKAAAVLEDVARRLLLEGIRKVEGDLILDDRAFDTEWIAPGWPRDQLDRWYAAPVAALSLNDNCLDVTIRPGSGPGEPARVSIEPETAYVTFKNEATTTAVRSRNVYSLSRKPGTCIVRLGGEVSSGAGPVVENVTVDNPPLFFGAVFKEALERTGISVSGRVRCANRTPEEAEEAPGGGSAAPPAKGRCLHVLGTPLWTTVEVTNKNSQNGYAEHVLKVLGYERRGLGSFANGVSAVSDFLAGVGVPRGTYRMVDGSGLSPENRFSPWQLVRVLAAMRDHPTAALAFFRSLPVSGTDGSLKDRLREEAYRGKVAAKTGYIRRASALSGYARCRSGVTATFSVLLNDFAGSNAEMKEIQDQICRAIVDEGA